MRKLISLFLFALSILLLPVTGFARDLYVQPASASDERCTSVTDACTLDSAISQVRSACTEAATINLAPGTYIVNNLNLNLPEACPVTLKGRGVTRSTAAILTAQNRTRVLDISSSFVVLENLWIQEGYLLNDSGAGIRIRPNAGVLAKNVHVWHNRIAMQSCNALAAGAGIFNEGSLNADALYVHDNIINVSDDGDDCSLADATYHVGGAGLQNVNTSSISTRNGVATIKNSTFYNNRLRFDNNEGSAVGAGISNVGQYARLYMFNDTISHNDVYARDYEAVSSDYFGYGGGLGNFHNAQAWLSHVTFFHNSADTEGREIANGAADDNGNAIPGGRVWVKNSIIDYDSARSVSTSAVWGSFTSEGNNLSNANLSTILNAPNDRSNAVESDILLSPIAYNGGTVPTHAIGGSASLANNGTGASYSAWFASLPGILPTPLLVSDQRGYFRNGAPDVGAYEFNGIVPTRATPPATPPTPPPATPPPTPPATPPGGGTFTGFDIVSMTPPTASVEVGHRVNVDFRINRNSETEAVMIGLDEPTIPQIHVSPQEIPAGTATEREVHIDVDAGTPAGVYRIVFYLHTSRTSRFVTLPLTVTAASSTPPGGGTPPPTPTPPATPPGGGTPGSGTPPPGATPRTPPPLGPEPTGSPAEVPLTGSGEVSTQGDTDSHPLGTNSDSDTNNGSSSENKMQGLRATSCSLSSNPQVFSLGWIVMGFMWSMSIVVAKFKFATKR